MSSVTLRPNQKVCLLANFTDAQGSLANVATAPVWSVGNSSLVSISPSGDGSSAVATSNTTYGTTTVTVSATGASGATVTASITVNVFRNLATQVTITAGTPVATTSSLTCVNSNPSAVGRIVVPKETKVNSVVSKREKTESGGVNLRSFIN
jgi:hypothetical protein